MAVIESHSLRHDWRENGVRTRLSVGKNAQDALTQRDKNPTPEDAAFHVESAMKFIDRFTRDELGLALADFLPAEFLSKVL